MSGGRLFSIGALVGLVFGCMVVDPKGSTWPLPMLYLFFWMLLFGLIAVAVPSPRK